MVNSHSVMAPNPMRSPWLGITLCGYSIESADHSVTVAYFASAQDCPGHLLGFLCVSLAKPRIICTEPQGGGESSSFLLLIQRVSRPISKAVVASGNRETLKKIWDQLENNLYPFKE